ncbi:RNA-directed DNA polymerase from mobile element jockey [Trichonephila clavipes]|nr:RNA-directed DNA polymerase from mobile element jockey [Trichonephila clavipes]
MGRHQWRNAPPHPPHRGVAKALEGPQPDDRQVALCKIQLGGPKPDFAGVPSVLRYATGRHYTKVGKQVTRTTPEQTPLELLHYANVRNLSLSRFNVHQHIYTVAFSGPELEPTSRVQLNLVPELPTQCNLVSYSGSNSRLNDYLEKENILVPEQHGFRPRLSTTHQLLRVVVYIKDGIDRHQYTAAVFLDIQKAFDRVWHTGLLFKLIMYKIPPPLIFLLKSYISDRSFTVKINRTFSQVRPAKAGVAQGSILGPVLFTLYVNDILKTTNTMICMYADDTAILSRHYNPNTLTQNINEHLAHLEIWFSVWKIALNTTKTEAVFFTQRRPPPEITLQNQRIPWSQHTKYLGVIIDKNLTFRQHITYVRNKFKNATRQLYSLIGKKSKLNRHNKMLIYTLILKPLLTYASPIWAHAARTNINLIEISQNVILRQILDAHWYMRNADIRSAL